MAASSNADRTAVVSGDVRLSTQELSDLADGGAGVIAESGAQHVAYVGVGGAMLPVLIFAAARAGLSFTPINYRLSAEGIQALIERLPEPLVIVDSRYRDMLGESSKRVMLSDDFLTAARRAEPAAEFADPESVAIVLFTSGTTSQPKAVELSHNNLTSYVTGTVEFDSAGAQDAALICVPPYHIAGVGAALSNLYAGRKMVYLPNFDANEWVRLIGAEQVSTATLVPTMLDRVVSVLETGGHELSSLRNLAYGGSKVGLPLVRRALELLPGVGFVNAYGLTETSSTIAVLTPDDHRAAQSASEVAAVKRLGSVGRPVPGIEIEIRDDEGNVLPAGETGELFVRGEQVSGRYTGIGSVLDENGWFPTKDIAMLRRRGLPVHRRAQRRHHHPRRREHRARRAGGGAGRASACARRRRGRRRRSAMGTGDRCRGGTAARRRPRSRGIAGARPQEFARFAHPRPRSVSRRAADHTHGQGAPPGDHRRIAGRTGRAASRGRKIMIKNGTRLTSQVCDTQVIVVRSADSLDDLRCGGVPMVPIGGERSGELDPAFSDGTVMGKRYVDEAGAEVLVTKPGAGSLSIGATALALKEVKPLPASD